MLSVGLLVVFLASALAAGNPPPPLQKFMCTAGYAKQFSGAFNNANAFDAFLVDNYQASTGQMSCVKVPNTLEELTCVGFINGAPTLIAKAWIHNNNAYWEYLEGGRAGTTGPWPCNITSSGDQK